MATTPTPNGHTPIEATERPEPKQGMPYLLDLQIYHAAEMFDGALSEARRLADQIDRDASNLRFQRAEVSLTAMHEQLSDAQSCMLLALHYAGQLHSLTCPHTQTDMPGSFGVEIYPDESPF